MRAETWIKTLNARLLTEPNWAIKAGYLTALIAASLALAAYLILTKVFGLALWFIPKFAKALIETVLSSHRRGDDDDDDDEWRDGHEGYGRYSRGVRID